MPDLLAVPTLSSIQEAADRIQDLVHRTPLLQSTSLNALSGADLYFKCENFQRVGAFKARGAANAVLKLSEEMRQKGVATHSSGNHAAALARAAGSVGIPAYIVMPTSAPEIKKKAVKAYGGEIIFCAPTLEARESTLQEVVERTGATFIPPYDHPDVVEGQGTCALEMWEQEGGFDTIVCPVGGGGLLGGTAIVSKALRPEVRVIAAEPAGADDAFRSFQAKERIPMVGPNTLADGLLTSLGELNFQLLLTHVDDVLTVTDAQIIQAMRLIYERLKIVVEPSCAVPLAAILRYPERFKGQKIGIILSGGNVDLDKLPFRL
ncbi:pyridoxal-5'-phosphate-dependent protein beta subunit [Nitritalea halalkaliphila LW7]|uniref:Pyridoxal-5'-phosphate-dependent protein beta subunit n=1 Tax=Nitritalea halalkaliphila LW7 TaxID=1189621 RepID=I5CAF1_9BACT|nr:pyridoxal-phosphate dependent enzyme [Nitritalea halalkaliphila]EIM78803.1 pyridoxal-5'-phosphate-dependent protein beta subunit [Nitritalea halalkaliphila LW7]